MAFSGFYPGTDGITSLTKGVRTMDPLVAGLGLWSFTDKTIYLGGFMVPAPFVATSVNTYCTSTGTSQTGSWIGIYQLDAHGNGTLLTQTAAGVGPMQTAGITTTALPAGGVQLSPGTAYAFAFLSVGPGSHNASLTGVGGLDNTHTAGYPAPFVCCTAGTGQTVLPATFTFASLTASTTAIYAEIVS